jgi:hypothetical protein
MMLYSQFRQAITVFQLIASDLDGTLLDANHMVDTFTSNTLQQLAAQGVQFVIATGRHYLDVTGIRNAMGIRAHLITSNGARIHDPDNQPVFSRDIDPAIVHALTEPCFTTDSLLNFYLDDAWLIDQPNEQVLAYHKDSGFQYQVCDLVRHSGKGVCKVLYISEHDRLLEIEACLQDRFGDSAAITFSAERCLEVMAPGVSKGHALQIVLDRLGIDASQCIAFGDGQNDVELLQTAGHPRLMGNAHPRLASQLPLAKRIGHNHEAGVAHHLRHLFSLTD